MMLETAEQMSALGINPTNKVRFIFFSGEEQGLLGSEYYVSQLPKKQRQSISAMLDYDMLASGNYGRFIYDGNGDEHGLRRAQRLGSDRTGLQGLLGQPGPGLRDHPVRRPVGLRRVHRRGHPRGRHLRRRRGRARQPYQVALYGGTAGEAFDPCYHQLCDTLANISEQGLGSTRTPRCTRS